MARELTEAQKKVLKFIADYQDSDENGRTPTNQQIADHMGYKTKPESQQVLNVLEKKGLIKLTRVKTVTNRKIKIIQNIIDN